MNIKCNFTNKHEVVLVGCELYASLFRGHLHFDVKGKYARGPISFSLGSVESSAPAFNIDGNSHWASVRASDLSSS